MLSKIIGVILGITLAAISITGCGFLEEKMETIEETEKSVGYTYTCVYIPHGEYEYETRFIFIGVNGERLDTYEMNYVHDKFLCKGYTVGTLMYTEDFTRAEMSVYSAKGYPQWYE